MRKRYRARWINITPGSRLRPVIQRRLDDMMREHPEATYVKVWGMENPLRERHVFAQIGKGKDSLIITLFSMSEADAKTCGIYF